MLRSWQQVWRSGPGPLKAKDIIALFGKGMLMGMADLVPGVSGGTVAFVTGIYESFLEAIASINKDLLKMLLKLQIKDALSQAHLRVILPILCGILFSIFSLARLMHYLMTDHPVPTWGAFLGLIFASIFVVGKHIQNFFAVKSLSAVFVGAILGYLAVSLIPVTTPYDNWFIFLCGIIGITAMLLPGISGSFLLLILGKYEYITELVKDPFNWQNFSTLLIFTCGTITGLLGFSKILNYCLKHYHNTTMAFLTGILIGTLKKIWPWKEVLESKIVRGKVRVLKEANILPTELSNEVILTIVLIIIGFVGIMLLEKSHTRKISQS